MIEIVNKKERATKLIICQDHSALLLTAINKPEGRSIYEHIR